MIADPGERQIGERDVVLGEMIEGDGIGGGIDRACAGQHHALGGAGGAGGVKDDGGVGALADLDLGVEPFGDRRIFQRLAARLDDLVDRMQVAVIVVAQAARLVVDHLLQLRQAVLYRHDLVDLLLVLDRGEAHLGVGQHERQFLGDRVGIDRHRNGAEHLGRHHRPIELGSVGADDGDGLAALEAEPVEAHRIGAHDFQQLSPGPGLPDAEVLVPHSRPGPVQMGVTDQQLGERIRRSGGDGRHSLSSPHGPRCCYCGRYLSPRRPCGRSCLYGYENTAAGRSSLEILEKGRNHVKGRF